jgi:hypothetical protein
MSPALGATSGNFELDAIQDSSFSRPENTASGVRRTNSGFFVEMGLHRKKLGLCIGCGSEVRNEGEH